MECDITFEKPVLKDMEEIARLLSSPAFYDENTHQLNFAAFNLRRFTNGEVESYVSLSRLSFIDQKHLNKKGKYVFKKTESHYVGYALFTSSYLANLQDRLRIYPVKAGLNDHCGMFFLGKDKKLICDDLTIRPYTLKTLRSLCDLLQANVVLK